MGNKEVSTSQELSRREVELQRDTGQTISTWCGNSLGNRDSCRQETFGEEAGKAVLEGKVDARCGGKLDRHRLQQSTQSLEWIADSTEGQQVSWLGTRLHLDQSLALPLATLPWEAASWVYCECLCVSEE